MMEPIKGYTSDSLIITAEALLERLDETGLIIIDNRPLEDYQRGHLPRARHMDLFRLRLNESGEAAMGAFIQTMEHVLADAGVNSESTVVFYDDISGMRAARGVFLMEYFNSHNAVLLDGGLKAWLAAGGETTTEPYEPKAGSFTAQPEEDLVASCQYILHAMEREDVVLLDTRRATEHTGEEVRAARGGHIPRAVHLEWKENLDEHGAFKPADALRSMYEAQGVTPDKEVITYCQGGYRSSNSWLALKLIGYPRVRNYLASWAEWGDREDTPIACPHTP